jgi:iron complex transport system permease protein
MIMPHALRLARFSWLIDSRVLVVLLVMVLLLIIAAMVATSVGATWIPIGRLLEALVGGGAGPDRLIVTQFRLPRVLLAILAGACLGTAGFLLQRVTRNALASPDILGVVDGAGFGVVLFLVLFSDTNNTLIVSIHWQPVAAVLGSLGLLGLTFLMARGQDSSPVRLVLFGVAIAAIAKAGTTLLLVEGPVFRASQALHWLAGAVHTANWHEVWIVTVAALPLLLMAPLLARALNALDLDAVSARAIGVPVPQVWLAVVFMAAALTAVAVAFAGGIGFVGLIAPHLTQRLAGRGSGIGLLGSAVTGALMVLLADLLVRIAFAPVEVPAGAVIAVTGAPYLLVLLARKSRTDG